MRDVSLNQDRETRGSGGTEVLLHYGKSACTEQYLIIQVPIRIITKLICRLKFQDAVRRKIIIHSNYDGLRAKCRKEL